MKFLISITTLSFTFSILAATESICKRDADSRVFSYEKPIGRSENKSDYASCTITMISPSCAIGAGHCFSAFENAHFNVQTSEIFGANIIDPSDSYEQDISFLKYSNK